MGVNDLWQILEPVKQHVHLQNLGGKTIAVDLSLWVCEAQTVKKMIGTVMKPHLRNLFFRISYLTQMDVKLVFVMEGQPPNLKADVISKRNHIRYGPSGKTWSQKTGRSRFTSVLRECLDMLECLGIPWVQAAGEAEAMCAYLNASGHVDGCLTNDGDAFLYGAQTVYRNFTMNTKDPHVDCYTMSSIQSKLGLDRDALVGLAILLGCDYLPKGVPGVGKEQALKLIQILKGQSLLERFKTWIEKTSYSIPRPEAAKNLAHCSVCLHPGSPKDHEHNGCKLCKSNKYCEPHDYEYFCPCEWHHTEQSRQLNAIENNIKKKACSCEGFPFYEVIQEYILNKDKLVKPIIYQRPDLLLFQRFTLEKMEWPNHYACEKLLVLLTRYDMIERKLGRKNSNQLQPIRIVKPRIRSGVHCLEIEWEKPEHFTMEDKQPGELILLTIEEESLFDAAYPEVVAVYKKKQLENKGKKQKNVKIRPKDNLPEADNVVNLQSLMTLKLTCGTFPQGNSKINIAVSPVPILSQESPPLLNSLPLSGDTPPCLRMQEQFMSSPVKQEYSQPNTSSHNLSVIANLHLSTIDWEGSSFSNSPDIQRNTLFHDFQPQLESEPSAIPHGFEHISEQSSCESEQSTTDNSKVLGRVLQKVSTEEHLLPSITGLCLQDLPLKERIRIKSLHPQDNGKPAVDLKSLSLLKVKETDIGGTHSECSSCFSKELLGIHMDSESKNCKVLKENQLLQEDCNVKTSIPHSLDSPIVKTSSVQVGLPMTALYPNAKGSMQSNKIVMKKSVCLERDSSDEESVPLYENAKYTIQKLKHISQKHSPAQLKESESKKLGNSKTHGKETGPCARSYRTAGDTEDSCSDPTKSTWVYQQCPKKDGDPVTCLDSPLPLCQRLKLRFQST
uniref:flap endonuclease GEN homolog 1 n=1 Tax=Jaculus jaculus TaxID=51337 RepID=UPI001E1B6059|nr:flap endonuclease GEN homolog 1 [Jaculus jaculus]XP_045006939.1 flap endonuclease GEN homolog 1 [Jaculus jaculus]XP_045006940.1 flap endonuclease GEN homolog 1 [Jaculus jaculus]XP_045006941.1 flap endonuclease GEN homolog 1 [Jaculus jaculus]